MRTLSFILKETVVSKPRVLTFAAVSGIANALLLIILNQAAIELQDGSAEIHLLLQYLLTFLLFLFAQRIAQRETVVAVEQAMQKVRIRLADKVRKCELRSIEQLGDISRYGILTQSSNMLSQAAMYMVSGFESLLVLLLAGLYLLWLSPPSFFVAVTLITVTIFLLIRNYRISLHELTDASEQESRFFSIFLSMVNGFKQIKSSHCESNKIFSDLQQLSEKACDLKMRSNARLVEDVLLSNTAFYLLLLIVVFLLPAFVPLHEENLFQVIATLLFMMEPLGKISAAIPNISKTNVTINGLYTLEKALNQAAMHEAEAITSDDESLISEIENFNTITLHNATFTYSNIRGRQLSTIGPMQMECQRGEIVFITGENGSGKSTCLKLLSGLYHCDSEGSVQIDGSPLASNLYSAYRELFSFVFGDFYVFETFYHLPEVDEKEINQWLIDLKLENHIQFQHGTFTYTGLSAGQHKRLAFIIALFQNRPVLVLDEFTTGQDLAFRKIFYDQILPALRSQGKTVILTSDDEYYFHRADRVYCMNAGTLQEHNVA